MSVPLDSLVGEVHLIEGARQSTTPATGVFTAPRRAARGREDDTLYVLIDLLGDVSSADLHSVMEQATRAYWSSQGSVTAALRAALTSANQWLMDHNTHASLPERLTGGVVCAVLRASEVYAAQAGPTSIFVRQSNEIERYPARDAEPLPAIGTTRALEMRYAHAHLRPGDTLLLADARFGAHTPLEVISDALSQGTVDRALDNLEKIIGKGDLIALVAQAAPAEVDSTATATAAAATVAVAGTVAGAAHSIEPAASTAPPVESTHEATTTVTQDGPIIHVAGRPSAAASTTAAGTPPTQSSAQTPPATPPPMTEADVKPPAFVVKSREWLAALGVSLKRSAGSLGKAGQLVAQRTTPEGTSVKAPALTRNQTLIMVAIVVAIPIIVGLLVSVVYAQQSSRETVKANIASAQNEIVLATQAVTGKETREHYAAAAAKAKDALGLDAENQEAKQILTQVQGELDKIDNVITLSPAVLWDFKTPGQRHLAGQGFYVFVLDRLANQVNRLILNSSGDQLEGNPEPILLPGMTVNGQTPGSLIDFTSIASPGGQQASNLIIGHDKGLIEYGDFGPQTVPFGENTLAKTVQRMRSFAGKLYTLDPSTQQIMRYEPRDNGYPVTPESYLGAALPDLAKATDMAIDGNIYVTLSDGRLLKYSEGQPAPFDIRNLGEPLQNPTIVAVDQNVQDSSVYVFDAGPKRIVQFRPDGLFVRQFRADSSVFDGVQDILVAEEDNRLYVINQGTLYAVQLPPLR
jgi:hypothetical protein